jgi:hypothetical protein
MDGLAEVEGPELSFGVNTGKNSIKTVLASTLLGGA